METSLQVLQYVDFFAWNCTMRRGHVSYGLENCSDNFWNRFNFVLLYFVPKAGSKLGIQYASSTICYNSEKLSYFEWNAWTCQELSVRKISWNYLFSNVIWRKKISIARKTAVSAAPHFASPLCRGRGVACAIRLKIFNLVSYQGPLLGWAKKLNFWIPNWKWHRDCG